MGARRGPQAAIGGRLVVSVLMSIVIALLTSSVIDASPAEPMAAAAIQKTGQQETKIDAIVTAEKEASPAAVKVAATIGEQTQSVEVKPATSQVAPSDTETEATKRKARADEPSAAAAASETKEKDAKEEASNKDKDRDIKVKVTSAPATSKTASSTNRQQSSGKSTAQSSGSKKSSPPSASMGSITAKGAATHYMSKPDTYSAIAAKHGSLAHEAMRKADKRRLQSGFGGIQKASGLADIFSPFKRVTDGGLARTLGASMRSIMKSKYSVPAYVASALLGAVALMAFYESPISPLPVPPLPEPPVGRFPPEVTNLPPGTQVPFRGQQQQQQQQQMMNYNQRSLNGQPGIMNMMSNVQQQPSNNQVLFASPGVAAERRQMTSQVEGAVQLAANLLGKQPAAQRKSALDYDPSSSRTFFGGSIATAASPANKPVGVPPIKAANILSYLGLTGAQGQSATRSGEAPGGSSPTASASTSPQSSVGVASSLVSRVKSIFTRSGSSSSSSVAASAPAPASSFSPASLMALIPGILGGNRKTSTPAASGSNKAQQVVASGEGQQTATSQSVTQPIAVPASSRMQVDAPLSAAKQRLGGSAVVKSVEKLATALLETFTSGSSVRDDAIQHTNSEPAVVARKSSGGDSIQSSLASTFLNGLMSGYESAQEAPKQSQESSASAPASAPVDATSSEYSQGAHKSLQASDSASIVAASPTVGQTGAGGQAVSRKTRSVGLEYPTDKGSEQGRHQTPSRAAQINSMVDYVANSYASNKLLFSFVMNQMGLSQAVPYVDHILGQPNTAEDQH